MSSLRYNPKKYKFVRYSKQYPKIFEKDKKVIIKAISDKIKIEHVGSTSVPGLGGKGIIDIAIFTPKRRLDKYKKALLKLGFVSSPNRPGDDRRLFMQKVLKHKGKERRVHVHLCHTREFWDSFIAFRNYMRIHKKEMKEYERIKKMGARVANGDGDIYYNYKEGFVSKISGKAFEEYRRDKRK